jgi:tubulin beta
MDSQIIGIHIGGFGNRIGAKFIEILVEEHELDSSGLHQNNYADFSSKNIFFRDSGTRWVSRSLFIDCTAWDDSPCGNFLDPDILLCGNKTTANNWCKGHNIGVEMEEEILDSVRKEVERCDSFHGFQFLHSIGGGAGSGLGSLIFNVVREQYYSK